MNNYLTVISGSDIDTIYDVESFPKAGDACLAREVDTKAGGCILNVGTIASYFGAPVKVLDYLKENDPGTDLLLSSIRASGMDCSHIRFGKDVVNGRCLIMRNGDEKCIFVIPPEHPVYKKEDPEIREVLANSGYIYSIAHTLIDAFGEDLSLLYQAREKGAKLALDGSSQYNDPREAEITEHADLLFINTQSYQRLSERYGRPAAEHLLEKGAAIICVTDGAKGSVCYTKDGARRMDAVKLEKVIDSTGAGDTFAAAFLSSLMKGDSVAAAHERATYAGARACLFTGAIDPSFNEEELQRFILQHSK